MSGGRGSDDVVAAPRANECLRHACSSTCGGTCEGAPIAYGAFHHYQHAIQQWGKGTGASALLVIEAAAAGAPRQKTTVYELYYIQYLTTNTFNITTQEPYQQVPKSMLRQKAQPPKNSGIAGRVKGLALPVLQGTSYVHTYIHTHTHTYTHKHIQAVFQGIIPRI
jgi:hypothetical protein